MWSTPVRVKDYYAAPPVTNSRILPPRMAGVYVATLKPISPGKGPSVHDLVLWVGITDRGQPELLYRVSGLVFDARGYTGAGNNPVSNHAYFHNGGRKIWLHCQQNGPDPRKIFLSWQTRDTCCPPFEEARLYQLLKGQRQFLNSRRPPGCRDGNHKH